MQKACPTQWKPSVFLFHQGLQGLFVLFAQPQGSVELVALEFAE
jgi:hypothetical protein